MSTPWGSCSENGEILPQKTQPHRSPSAFYLASGRISTERTNLPANDWAGGDGPCAETWRVTLLIRPSWVPHSLVCSSQGKSGDRVGFFPANFVQRVRPGERVWRVVQGVSGSRERGHMAVRESQVRIGCRWRPFPLIFFFFFPRSQKSYADEFIHFLSLLLDLRREAGRRREVRETEQREEARPGPSWLYRGDMNLVLWLRHRFRLSAPKPVPLGWDRLNLRKDWTQRLWWRAFWRDWSFHEGVWSSGLFIYFSNTKSPRLNEKSHKRVCGSDKAFFTENTFTIVGGGWILGTSCSCQCPSLSLLPTRRVSSAHFRVFFVFFEPLGTDISFVSRASCQEHALPFMESYSATQKVRKEESLHQTCGSSSSWHK